MENWDIIIIGAGAAGMLSAVSASREKLDILILERNEKAGKKILITGKGRCNITNMKSWEEFSMHIHPSPRLLKPAFFTFTNQDTKDFFESLGLNTVVERGTRLFPASGRSSDVVESLTNYLTQNGTKIKYNSRVTKINTQGTRITSVCWNEKGVIKSAGCKALIVATGGLSYPLTGSEGDGYNFAKALGHTISPLFPSLTALMPRNYDLRLKGLLLKNIGISLLVSGVDVQNDTGEAEFTDAGIEGSLGYRISRKAVRAIVNGEKVSVVIDLKPALTVDQIIKRAEREQKAGNCRNISQLLGLLLPSRLVLPFAEHSKLKPDGRIDNQESLFSLASALKKWTFEIKDFRSYDRAVITAGGINAGEVTAKNMKSRLYDNLFFAGEILDMDGDTGGYNLQIAFSTGYLAGREAAHLIKTSNSGEEK